MLSADDVLAAQFRAVKFRPGYDQDEVDDFLDRAARTLREAAGRPPTRRDVTPDEVDSTRFSRTTWREGYDIADVDAFLAELRPSIAQLPTATVLADAPPAPAPAGPTRTGWARVRYVLEYLTIGEPPPESRRHAKAPRAARASSKRVIVTAAGVTWSSPTRTAQLAASEIAEVTITRVRYGSDPGVLVQYALLLDPGGAVRLRVSGATVDAFPPGLWERLGIPVTRTKFAAGRAKDARRCWPEAFGFLGAYPVATALLAFGAFMLVGPVVEALLR